MRYDRKNRGRPRRALAKAPVSDDAIWLYLASDTHYTPNQNSDNGDPVDRLREALLAMPGKPWPGGGTIGSPLAVMNIGDCIHEEEESIDRFAADRWDLFTDGNHDGNQTRDLIVERFGSLTWGFKVGRVFFQAMTEEFTSYASTFPPSVAQINGPVASSLAVRPPDEPTIFFFHRAINGGYIGEWAKTAVTTITEDLDTTETGIDVASTVGLSIGQRVLIDFEEVLITNIVSLTLTVARGGGSGPALHTSGATVYAETALDALHSLAATRNVVCFLHGHNHYSAHYTSRSIRTYSPGSITQAPIPGPPPYATTYPESFLVMRIGRGFIDVGNYIFGYIPDPGDPTLRVWDPDTWEWWERHWYDDREVNPL